jgi:hypothetical protein
MGLAYSGGVIQKVAIDGSTGTTIYNELIAALVAAGWTSTPIAGGQSLKSATTTTGLSFVVEITLNAGSCRVQATSLDGSASHTQMTISPSAARIYYVITNQYSFWLYLPSITVGEGAAVTAYFAGVPFIPDPVEPLIVQDASNTSPVVITTTAAHGLTTGDFVFVDGVEGNTGANGHYSITVLTPTTFSLTTSTGTGAYTSGGLVGTNDRLSRCFYSSGTANGVFPTSWRATPLGQGFGVSCLTVNEISFNGNDQQLQLLTSNAASWRDSRYTITEPYVYAPVVNGGTKYIQFQLWNCAIISGSPQVTIDTTTTFNGHSWHIYGSNSTCAIAVAYT